SIPHTALRISHSNRATVMIGPLGSFFILVSFLACGAAAWFYYGAARHERYREANLARGRRAWAISVGATIHAAGFLLYLLATHRFEFNYVYSYTSLSLPWYYVLSAFWAGQEGSFVLWILFNGLVGAVLVRRA